MAKDADPNPSGDSIPIEGDSRLSDGAKTGEFVSVLGAHEQEIFGYVYALLVDWDDAQEVMQRVRIRLWEQFDRYDREKPFGPWARAVAYYLVLAYRKERVRQRKFFSPAVLELVSDTFDQEAISLPARREVLRQCLKKLEEKQRNLIAAYYERARPVADLATRLGMEAGTLRQSVFRIRRVLRNCVGQSMR